MTKTEIFENFGNLSEDELNAKKTLKKPKEVSHTRQEKNCLTVSLMPSLLLISQH